MEQIDDTIVNSERKIPIQKKPIAKGLIILCILVVTLIYLFWWIPRQECVSKISYYPAMGMRTEGYYELGTSGYYTLEKRTFYEFIFGHKVSYNSSGEMEPANLKSGKFKGQDEALQYCLSNR